MLTRLNPKEIHLPAGQYSHATRVAPGATLLYIAGQVGIDRHGELVKGFERQVCQAWENLLCVLESAGFSASDLVHVNSYLVDGVDIGTFRELRKKYLPEIPPSSTTLILPRLISPDWLFEIDAVAART